MDRREFIAAAGGTTAIASAPQAFAVMGGAFLDHAVPGVGLTVSGPVREVRLYFDLGVEAARVQVMSSTGTMIRASRPFINSSSREIVTVRLGQALGPGIYLVSWDVISVAGSSTSGTFRFTVS
jgi:methionine-rich copper-binding protein CopC